jgi:Fe-S cluster assembly protein SufD
MKEPILFSQQDFPPVSEAQRVHTDPGMTRFSFHPFSEGGRTVELDFHAARDSSLEVVVFQDVPVGEKIRLRARATAEAGSCLRLTIIQRGGASSSVELVSEAMGSGARIEVRGLNVAGAGQTQHFRAESIHGVPGTSSDLQVWNAASGDSRTLFSGLVRIGKGARQTEAFQKNRNLILSDRAVVDSIPKLLIANDDVKCAHGSSTSTLDPDQEVYLRSRGIGREEAERMLVQGFIGQALSGIGDDRCRTAIGRSFNLDGESWTSEEPA